MNYSLAKYTHVLSSFSVKKIYFIIILLFGIKSNISAASLDNSQCDVINLPCSLSAIKNREGNVDDPGTREAMIKNKLESCIQTPEGYEEIISSTSANIVTPTHSKAKKAVGKRKISESYHHLHTIDENSLWILINKHFSCENRNIKIDRDLADLIKRKNEYKQNPLTSEFEKILIERGVLTPSSEK